MNAPFRKMKLVSNFPWFLCRAIWPLTKEGLHSLETANIRKFPTALALINVAEGFCITPKLLYLVLNKLFRVSKFDWKLMFKPNQIFSCCIMLNCVRSLRDSSLHHCAWETQLLVKKCYGNGKLLAILHPIWPARDLNLKPPAIETNAYVKKIVKCIC